MPDEPAHRKSDNLALSEAQAGHARPRMGVDQLTGAQETLLVPLWARAAEFDQPDPILRDAKAVEVAQGIDYPFDRFRGGVAYCLRTKILDRWARRYLDEHPQGTVVEVGAGLGTRFERLDNGRACWFDLDLPEAMAVRRRFFEPARRRTFLAASVLETAWMSTVEEAAEGPVFFAIEGVLYYLQPDDVRGLFVRLADRFPGAWIAFDSHSRLSRAYSQLFDPIRRTGGRLVWTGSRRRIASWDPRFRRVESSGLWDDPADWKRYRHRLGPGLRLIFQLFPPARQLYCLNLMRLD